MLLVFITSLTHAIENYGLWEFEAVLVLAYLLNGGA